MNKNITFFTLIKWPLLEPKMFTVARDYGFLKFNFTTKTLLSSEKVSKKHPPCDFPKLHFI
jgi:hypothetical protein